MKRKVERGEKANQSTSTTRANLDQRGFSQTIQNYEYVLYFHRYFAMPII